MLRCLGSSSTTAAAIRRRLVSRVHNNHDNGRKLQTLAVTASTMNNNNSSSSSSSNQQLSLYRMQEPPKLVRHPHVRAFSTTNEDNKEDDDDKKTTTSTSTKKTNTNSKTMEFQAETKQLLDIVTNSLYTDKEVFLRELISNASDACEKLRHLQQTTSNEHGQLRDPDHPLEIRITLDEVESKITIQDTGIGMTQDELVQNLGTIARSGSKQFLAELQEESQSAQGGSVAQGIIGKFGVGFYSVFMVAHKVVVTTQPAKSDEPASVWTSKDGSGTFELATLEDEEVRQDRGTTIDIYLDSDYWHLLHEAKIKEILNKYSNFVSFPIYLNGELVNTVQAVWTQSPKDVEYQTYADFYKFIANAVDDPLDILHFRADAPLEIQALLFIPSFHSEKYGMERMEPGVSLYSRKVLIESKSADILPDWLRFLKGVVDSQDLPLAISREKPQDTALIAKLRKSLTRKFLSHLEKMAKKDPEKYLTEFYREYSFFLKEGVCQDYDHQSILAKLLRFETNKNKSRDIISLDEYISNMRPEQNDIYYLCAPTREAAAMSPYLEAFEKEANLEVIFIYTAIDDFVMANIGQYEGRNLVSVEKGDIDLSTFKKSKDDKKDKKDGDDDDDDSSDGDDDSDGKLDAAQAMDLCIWFRDTLGDKKVNSCLPSSRLVSSPAIVTDNESGAMRRMMRMVDTSDGTTRDSMPLPKQNVEINPSHPIVVGLYKLKDTEPVLARILAEQVYDNCLVAAGLLDDSRTMLPRLNDLLVSLVRGAQQQQAPEGDESDESKEEGKPNEDDGETKQ